MKLFNVAQTHSEYYSGDVPGYEGSHIGSPSVDVSDLSSQFGDAQKSVDLVNQFDSGLLTNIVYMFNFSKSGVYGVYIPSLDREVKTKELEKRLVSIGYNVVDEDGMLKAYPIKEEKDQETVQKEIQSIYSDLESKGGSVIGLNIGDTTNEMEQSFANIKDGVPEESHGDLKNDLMIAHMAATMAHEATHAAGHESESVPTQVESALLNSALAMITEKYGIEGGLKLSQGCNSNWYKESQHKPFYPPSGSDLDGRHNKGDGNLQGQADYGMLAQQYQNRAIEEMLGSHFQSPLPPDLSPAHDSYELQLRKYTRDDWSLNPKLIFEELLRDSHVNDGSEYKSMEQLLEDSRPQPLMTIMKKASRLVKEATLFGWYNNLEISNGSTIPGMGDRVKAWDDRDESFAEHESWIKGQPRYNPSYDVKGFYYRWIEPIFKPQTWYNFTRDLSNTHPAKRFASSDGLGFIVDALRSIRNDIVNRKIKATRIICSEDILQIIDKAMSGGGIDVSIFSLDSEEEEEIFACWIHGNVDFSKIEKVEESIQNNDEHLREIMEKLVGCKPTLTEAISVIMKETKKIAKEYDLDDVYAIGSYARELSLGNNHPEVEELEFTSNSPSSSYKFGYILAENLGVVPVLNTGNKYLLLNYKGVKIMFNGGKRINSVEKWMNKRNIDTTCNILHDICNKDFTVNAKAYSPYSGVVASIFSDDDDSIKTVMNPDDVLSFNPFIIMRAIYLSLRCDMSIDEDLEKSMIKFAPLLSKYPCELLNFAKIKIEAFGEKEAAEIFEKYHLNTQLNFGE